MLKPIVGEGANVSPVTARTRLRPFGRRSLSRAARGGCTRGSSARTRTRRARRRRRRRPRRPRRRGACCGRRVDGRVDCVGDVEEDAAGDGKRRRERRVRGGDAAEDRAPAELAEERERRGRVRNGVAVGARRTLADHPMQARHARRGGGRRRLGLRRHRRRKEDVRTITILTVCRAIFRGRRGVARRSLAGPGLRRQAIRWAAVSQVRAPPRWGRDPLWIAAVPDRTPGRRGHERGHEDRPSEELAGRLVPGSPAPYPRAALLYARPAGPESVTMGSAEWVDWLTAESPLPRLRVSSGE